MAIPPSTVKVWPVIYAALSSVAMNLSSRDRRSGHASKPHQDRVVRVIIVCELHLYEVQEQRLVDSDTLRKTKNHMQGLKKAATRACPCSNNLKTKKAVTTTTHAIAPQHSE